MAESDNTPTTEESTAPPTGEDQSLTPQEKRDALAELLEGKTDTSDQGEPGDAGKPPDGEDQDDGKLDTLDAIAKKLGVEVSSLYDIAITQPGDGEDRISIGELADIAKDRGQLELDRLEFDEVRQKGEADLMRAQQEVNEIIQLLPKSAIKPELLDAVARKMQATQDRERGLTLRAIPDWKNEETETADRKAMGEHLAKYGYPANYLENVHDHRQIKYIRDNWQRAQNMERAIAALRTQRKSGHKPGSRQKPGKKPGDNTQNARNVGQRRHAQVEQVAELLRST